MQPVTRAQCLYVDELKYLRQYNGCQSKTPARNERKSIYRCKALSNDKPRLHS